jgi:hypothetical protein
MLELLKNSMRATVEWHGVDGDFPPIKIVIADGSDNEDVVIKISDEGKLHRCGNACFFVSRQGKDSSALSCVSINFLFHVLKAVESREVTWQKFGHISLQPR